MRLLGSAVAIMRTRKEIISAPDRLTVVCIRERISSTKPIKTHLKKIERVLDPLDVVATKLGRLDSRDFDDIEACVKGLRLTKEKIIQRAKATQYAGNQKVYDHNLITVTNKLF
ncbi:MAG: hypothetical protein HY619_07755 [Thaumarchaeota archaeon]|nr:hypothetical protein [Nitrososphaerota archaeon]